MKKNIIISLFICILSIGPACAEEGSSDGGDVIIPSGMEVIKEGDVNVVVPMGGRLRKQDSVMLIETADEYASRKFADTDNRFERIEKELEAQKKELEAQKKGFEDLKSTINKP